jgi:hypothetical protein
MKEKLQMVDDDQVENVGIMSGFMDEIDELLEEISGEEQEEGDDADMARMMARTPDSPEILMNNLRGDMRSIDARREELADLVGFREAEDTPEGVLTLLQSVLAQQAAAPAMPMPAPMPQGMPLKWPEWLHLLCHRACLLRWVVLVDCPWTKDLRLWRWLTEAWSNILKTVTRSHKALIRGALPNLIQLLQTLDCPHTLLKRFRQR